MCTGHAYSRLSTEPEVMWHQSREGFLIITALLFALVCPEKVTERMLEYIKYIQVKMLQFL